MRVQAQASKLLLAGKLWNDDIFNSMKMDAFCKEFKDSLEVKENKQPVKILRLWQEWWEQKKVGPQGHQILEARLTKKNQGLKFCDIDKNNKVMTVHKMIFQKQHGNNAYHVFETLPGFNCQLPDDNTPNNAYWQPWKVNEDLFDCMRVYYKQEENRDNVKTCELGGECQSNEE
jgi:hypothetical protein